MQVDSLGGKDSAILERIALQMISSLELEEVLTTVTQGLVDELDAAFARIWLVGAGDICAECYKASDCRNRERCLHLAASSGMYTNVNGEYRRVPLGAMKIGRIAEGEGPISTNDVLEDPRLPNKQWIKENDLRSFAGHPLTFRGELLGVLAMFGRRPMSEAEFDRLAAFANQAAIAIKNARLFSEVKRLRDRLRADNRYLREEIDSTQAFEEIIGQSSTLRAVLSQVDHVAPTTASVLILGESGTGKELFARAIHKASLRNKRPLIKVNCAAIPSGLVESEMFGHEKGAFTGALQRRIGRFELADGGTIFLDEIGDLPLDLQGKLLRVLQEQEFERLGGTKTIKVDVRVIAATNRDLEKAVQENQFREDLYYRLSVFPIRLPPLRERKQDIPTLCHYFVKTYAREFGKRTERISSKTLNALTQYQWPGNIRELENVIGRAVILSDGSELELHDALPRAGGMPASSGVPTLDELQRAHIHEVLQSTGWRVSGESGAAKILGIKPTTLESRMKKLGIKRDP